MLKRYKYAISALLFVMLLTACAQAVPTPEPVTLSFVHAEDNSGQYETWVQQFQEQHPYITVELSNRDAVPFETLATYDTFMFSQFEMLPLLQQQTVMNIAPLMEQDDEITPDMFYSGAMDVFNSEGKQWALPFGLNMLVMYYNRDVFDRYNAPYPQMGWTWNDFLDRATVVNHPADVFGYALHYNDQFAIFEPVTIIYQYGGRIFDSLQNPTRATLNEAANIEAMTFYASLIHRHSVAPLLEEVAQMGRPYPWRGVLEGRFAMWTGMYGDRGGIAWPTAWKMNWGMVPLPRQQHAATLGMVEGLFVSAQTQHPDECWLWIKFLSTQMPNALMPARRSLAQSAEYEQRVGSEVAVTARAAVEEAILVNPNLLGFEKALGAMQQAFEAIRNGDATAEQALDAAQAQGEF